MATFASDSNEAEKGAVRSLPPSRQTTLAPEHQPDRYHSMTDGSRVSTAGGSGQQNQPAGLEDFLNNWCRTTRDYDEAPSGWSKLAYMPARIDGTDVIRNFNVLGMRLMQYTGGRLAFMQQMLDEHDREQHGIQNLTRHQTRLPGDLEEKEYYDMLIEGIKTEYREYGELVRLYKEINQLHPLSWLRVKQVVRYFLKCGLENQSLLWINTPHEAVTFTKPPPCLLVWFSETRLGELFLGVFATSHHPADEPGSKAGFIRLSATTILHRGSIILCALALLIPTGILFLCGLSRANAFAVVVVSTLVFSLQINLEDRNKTVYAVCALSAVLVTVMVQMAGVSPEP